MNHRMTPNATLEAELRRQLACLGESRTQWFNQPPSAADPEARELMETLNRYERTLGDILSGAVPDPAESLVLIGSEVTIRFEDGEPDETWRIVFPDEADVDRNRISCLSPMGRSLLLARTGDTVEIRTPHGGYRVRIVGCAFGNESGADVR